MFVHLKKCELYSMDTSQFVLWFVTEVMFLPQFVGLLSVGCPSLRIRWIIQVLWRRKIFR